MDKSKKRPPWVDPATPDRPWIDVTGAVPWLRDRPYLAYADRAVELRGLLESAGFSIVEANPDWGQAEPNPERIFLQELTRRMGFREAGAGSWGAFSDRLWDFLSGSESTPYAVLIAGLDTLAVSDTYHFLRCVHNLLSLTEGVALADSVANRQIEYFFLGEWKSPNNGTED
jgi:hypothetical protein